MMLGTFICFYSCWTAIAIWLILGVVTDWEEEYRLLYDGRGVATIDAMIAIRVGLHVELIVILYKCLS